MNIAVIVAIAYLIFVHSIFSETPNHKRTINREKPGTSKFTESRPPESPRIEMANRRDDD